MSNDEIVYHLSIQIHLLDHRYDSRRAQDLDSVISRWLGVEPCIVPYPTVEHIYKDKKISLDTMLNYLNARTSLYLNVMNTTKTVQSLRTFDIVANGQKIDNILVDTHYLLKADFLFRSGKYDETKKVLKKLTEKTTDADILSKAYMIIGKITVNEYNAFYPEAAMEPLSKALVEAERINDLSSIVDIYNEIGQMLDKDHPALGLSIHWKAQVLAEKSKDEHKIYVSRLYRARAYISILMRYNGLNNPEKYQNEAERLISSIDRDKIPTELLKAFYDETYGFVMGDDACLDRALSYFMLHHAYDKVYILAENIGGKALFKKDYEKWSRMMDLCIQAAKNMNSTEKLRSAVECKKKISHDELERQKKVSDK